MDALRWCADSLVDLMPRDRTSDDLRLELWPLSRPRERSLVTEGELDGSSAFRGTPPDQGASMQSSENPPCGTTNWSPVARAGEPS